MGPLLDVRSLETTFFLPGGPVPVVKNISFQIHSGEIFGLVGESGSGKSMTALSLLRLISPPGQITGGEVLLNGVDLLKLSEKEIQRIRGKEIGMIFQDPLAALNPVLTMGQQLDEQIQEHEKISSKEARARSIELLESVGIASPDLRYHQYPHQFSGGMRQRAMIAMALSCNPKLLIADEPTTALDVTIQSQILALLQGLQSSRGLSVLLISHDLGVISSLCDSMAVLREGQICEGGPTTEIMKAPKHPYTQSLLEALAPH